MIKNEKQEISIDRMAPKSAMVKFKENFVTNLFFGITTVPPESAALNRVRSLLKHPYKKPLPYHVVFLKQRELTSCRSIFMAIDWKKLCQGGEFRTGYCLIGNAATLKGFEVFGDNLQGVIFTNICKNGLLPLSLITNSRQDGDTWRETYKFTLGDKFVEAVKKREPLLKILRSLASGPLCDPVVHGTFFARNALAGVCLLPGLAVRDYTYQAWGEKDTKIPTLLGLATAVFFSTVMNSLVKPFFTGKYPDKNRRIAMMQFYTFMFPIMLREIGSISLVFGNNSPKKKER